MTSAPARLPFPEARGWRLGEFVRCHWLTTGA